MSTPTLLPELEYPDSDGQPMSDNTLQFEWIVTIEGGYDDLFREDASVFVAGDLLWYPVHGQPWIRAAGDVYVVFGRPKGYRGSYKQWEEDDIPPQVVWEILSPGNRPAEMDEKRAFYQQYGVEEYCEYDPYAAILRVWRRAGDVLQEVASTQGWVSPRTGVRHVMEQGALVLYRPDGQRFKTYLELAAEGRAARAEADQERRQREHAEALAAEVRAQMEAERQRTEAERQRAEAERQRAEAERQRAEELAARLRALGINPDA